ncbi:GtrA family protein [Paraburkholderia terrae]
MIKTITGESNRIVRFIAVGALNTVFGLTVYSMFIWCGSPTWLALIGGNLAGLAFNFVTTGGLVFADLSPRRIPAFAAVYIGTYLLNLGLIHGLSPIIGGPILSQVVLTPIMAVIAYLLMSRVVFSDRTGAKRQNP